MLLMCKSTINGHVQWVNPRTKSTITMFYVANCESLPGRVNLHFPVVFLWFSYGFPMVYQAGCPQNIRLGPRGHPLPAARQRALGDHPPSGAPRTWDEIHPSIIYIWYDMYWYLWYIYIYNHICMILDWTYMNIWYIWYIYIYEWIIWYIHVITCMYIYIYIIFKCIVHISYHIAMYQMILYHIGLNYIIMQCIW